MDMLPHRATSLALFAVLAALTVGVGACVANEPAAPTRGMVVSGPPPPPQQDAPTPQPSPQAVWVPGYWHWTGAQYTWIPGHWETPPPGVTWAAPRYSLVDGSTVYEPGAWTRAPAPPPPPGVPPPPNPSATSRSLR